MSAATCGAAAKKPGCRFAHPGYALADWMLVLPEFEDRAAGAHPLQTALANASDFAVEVRVLCVEDWPGSGCRRRKIGGTWLVMADRRRPRHGRGFVTGFPWTNRYARV